MGEDVAELKTKKTEASVESFLNSIPDESKRTDSNTIISMMKEASKAEPKMWGTAIIGFGDYHYKSKSGREGDWFKVGYSPRKQNLTLYLGFDVNKHQDLLSKLGKYKTGKGCLYINKLKDIDTKVLKELIKRAVKEMSR